MIFKKHIAKKKQEMTEQIASAEIINGSRAAFDFLYDLYGRNIYAFCLRLLGEKEAAEDAFQETFCKVYEKCRDFRGENFHAWLFTIARNTCMNIIRSRKNFEEVDENALIIDSNEMQIDSTVKECINAALQKLPLAYREAIILRDYEEYSYEEIAEILGIEKANVKVRIDRARLLMKKMLTPIVRENNEN